MKHLCAICLRDFWDETALEQHIRFYHHHKQNMPDDRIYGFGHSVAEPLGREVKG